MTMWLCCEVGQYGDGYYWTIRFLGGRGVLGFSEVRHISRTIQTLIYWIKLRNM
jgi:hypothetical protein